MTRLERLKEYSNPLHGPQGAGRDEKNIRFWQARAEENSQLAPRATDKAMALPSTNRQMGLRSTKSAPRTDAAIDARMRGKNDLNHEGSDYMKSIRRT
jgi:hypothetical protein